MKKIINKSIDFIWEKTGITLSKSQFVILVAFFSSLILFAGIILFTDKGVEPVRDVKILPEETLPYNYNKLK